MDLRFVADVKPEKAVWYNYLQRVRVGRYPSAAFKLGSITPDKLAVVKKRFTQIVKAFMSYLIFKNDRGSVRVFIFEQLADVEYRVCVEIAPGFTAPKKP